jgi:alpha-D-ribose 1-methylphosphonate 5-triphosphate diphosphatase
MTGFCNARIVLGDEVVHGSLAVVDGRIGGLGAGGGLDLDGDFLIPGIIDLHTDNLERQVLPRSNARWPSRSAFLSHDAQCVAAGITTVFDALCLGDIGFEKARQRTFEDGVEDLRALAAADALKAEHFLHLRCELPAPEMAEMLARAVDEPLVRLISLMDHSPGLGQYADVASYARMRAAEGHGEGEIAEMVALLKENRELHHEANRRFVLDSARDRGVALASHDDRTVDDVARNHQEGIGIAEFPVTMAAAQAARDCGMRVIAGAPNIVRGGSHNGNVSALALVRDGLVDALASDYVPAAMLEAAFACAAAGALELPAAVRLVTAGPAALVGLADRGRIAPGLRADLVRVRVHDGLPVVRAVWRAGERIA